MSTIFDLRKKYLEKIEFLDLEIIIAHSLGKTREFVLAYPESELSSLQQKKIRKLITRRTKGEPVAYITGHKEFYGLDFAVDKNTLIPRPETELLVELALTESKVKGQKSNVVFVDVGTGSGNIIISLAKNIRGKNIFFATDISQKALAIAEINAKKHRVDKKIKFIKGNLLEPIFKTKNQELKTENCIIVANLPYLSKEIYQATPVDVKRYEPKSALYSAHSGLAHYEKLLKQIKSFLLHAPCSMLYVFLEISPEQKKPLAGIIKNILPAAKIGFAKDLAGKWRICKMTLLK